MEVNKDPENIIPSSEESVDIAKPTINEEFSTEMDSAEKEALEIENDVVLNTADVSDEITEKKINQTRKK